MRHGMLQHCVNALPREEQCRHNLLFDFPIFLYVKVILFRSPYILCKGTYLTGLWFTLTDISCEEIRNNPRRLVPRNLRKSISEKIHSLPHPSSCEKDKMAFITEKK
uniref:Uncharacterized protein n=1 Tax=Glossina austeni TaxID=7395 RepID=A0A1A9V091_GLOAU